MSLSQLGRSPIFSATWNERLRSFDESSPRAKFARAPWADELRHGRLQVPNFSDPIPAPTSSKWPVFRGGWPSDPMGVPPRPPKSYDPPLLFPANKFAFRDDTVGAFHVTPFGHSFVDLISNDPSFWEAWMVANSDCLRLLASSLDADVYLQEASQSAQALDGYLDSFAAKLYRCDSPPIRVPGGGSAFDLPSFSEEPGLAPLRRSRYREPETTYTTDEFSCELDYEELLIAGAFRLLRENFDIVKWLACVVSNQLADCLEAFLFNSAQRLEFILVLVPDDLVEEEGWAAGNSDATGEVCGIAFRTNAAGTRNFCAELGNNPTPERVACALTRIAAVMLHEMMHCCERSVDRSLQTPGHTVNDCDLIMMLPNAFQWAMSHRYPLITSSNRCSDHAAPESFWSDRHHLSI
jgi:hypothetical protein